VFHFFVCFMTTTFIVHFHASSCVYPATNFQSRHVKLFDHSSTRNKYLTFYVLAMTIIFSCAWQNISVSCTLLFLNTTLFLRFHISDTIVIHIPFHALTTFKFSPNKWKLSICRLRYSCLIVSITTYLSHASHTLCTTLQVINKLFYCFLTFQTHKTYQTVYIHASPR